MIASAQTDKFAAYLRALKARSGRGFDRLAKQAGISGSSLHRYCSGLSVPADYRVVHSFAKACGASAEELRELHRLWALADADKDAVAGPDATPGTADPPRRTATSRTTVLFAVLVTLVGVLVWVSADRSAESSAETGGRLLYSPKCPSVTMGQRDECVAEVQGLLARVDGKLAVDGSFGPETLRRLTAFQVLAGLPAKGVVDVPTKDALYAQRTSMETWSPARVEGRIREVFVEAPDTAVAIARCSSFLDPLWVLPNTNGSRNWGVFQLSDARLRDLDGTALRAFDPAWNIEAAHRLWTARHDFHDWPSCEAALTSTAH
ncbi:helix-turn-helix domain-containing protein [Umezawaea endophytica]|uniref:Helix-turn-helix domain-containing protein n=1 Tax=Umezawaea endophytica TaxID=1654476 RepID=A0A9X2VFQ1_9PSEU|nr:helix-turn-helix domain-containing protein [Umezawaea endophytica]MCS7475825.1 helix-turn-helix domain-containing protein [Umezawaea endophytica]